MSRNNLTIEEIKKTWKMLEDTNCNMSIDEAKYIADYLEKHPDKKYTRFIRWKWCLKSFLRKS